MMISISLDGSVKHVTARDHSPLIVGLHGFELVQDLRDVLLLVEEIVGLAVVLVKREGATFAQSVTEGLRVVLLLTFAEDHDLSLILSCFGAENRTDERNLSCKF